MVVGFSQGTGTLHRAVPFFEQQCQALMPHHRVFSVKLNCRCCSFWNGVDAGEREKLPDSPLMHVSHSPVKTHLNSAISPTFLPLDLHTEPPSLDLSTSTRSSFSHLWFPWWTLVSPPGSCHLPIWLQPPHGACTSCGLFCWWPETGKKMLQLGARGENCSGPMKLTLARWIALPKYSEQASDEET